MKIELVKEITGSKIMWFVKVDGFTQAARLDEKEAHTAYHEILDSIKNGTYHKEVIIESETF